MGQVDDLLDGLKEGIKKRIDTPFLASFALSFCATNYKLLLVIFGAGDYEKKILFIDKVLYPSGKFVDMAFIPFVSALTYTLAWPLIEGNLAAINVWNENRKRKLVLIQERQTPIPYQEMALFFSAYTQKNEDLNRQIAHAHEAAHANTLLMNELFKNATKRSEEIAWGRLADSMRLSATEVREILESGRPPIQTSNNESRLNLAPLKPLAAAVAYLLRIPSENGFRFTTLDELQAKALDGYEEYALAFSVYEILRSLGIVDAIDEKTGTLRMVSAAESRAHNILRIFAAAGKLEGSA